MPLIVCAQSDAVDGFCQAHGVTAQIRYRIDDNQTLVGLAAAGLGAALLPRIAVDPARPDVAEVELTTDLPSRTIALAWHRDREQPQFVRALIDVARQVCDQL